MVEPVYKLQARDTQRVKAGERILMPSAELIAEYIAGVADGSPVDVGTMRRELAERYDAAVTCPVTTGIVLRELAEEANARREAGASEDELVPVWRVLDAKASVVKRLSFDAGWMLARRGR